MPLHSLTRAALAAVLATGFLAPAAAELRQVDVGTATPVTVDTAKPLKVALFIEIGTNTAVQATVTGAKREAARHGIQVDVFDARFDIARQVSQMQNALERGYNAWIVAAIEGQQACHMATVEAPKRNILVAVVTMPICGRSANEGNALWAPGSLAYVGGNETPSAFRAVIEQAIRDNPGPRKVGLLTGQEIHPITRSFDSAVAQAVKKHPDFKVVAVHRTDYSPEMSQQRTQTLLQAHPDLDVIIGVYTNMSKGAVPALQAAGRIGKVKVYEAGGTAWSIDALRQGWIQATTGYYRATAAETAMKALIDARAGKPVQRVHLNDGHALLPGQAPGSVAVITKGNVGGYTPEAP